MCTSDTQPPLNSVSLLRTGGVKIVLHYLELDTGFHQVVTQLS